MRWRGVAGGLVGAALLVLAGVSLAHTARRTDSRKALVRVIPEQQRDGYVGSGACRACHPSDYTSWYHSYHRTMTQPATPQTVLAPFDGRELHDRTGSYRVQRRGEEYWVYTRDPTWLLEHMDDEQWPSEPPWVWRRVVMITGKHHMQVYWLPGKTPRSLHAFPFSYLTDAYGQPGQWVPNESTLLRPPIDDGVYTWNDVCIKCHAVAGAPRISEDPQVGGDNTRADTAVAELGIACESCHGPGAQHVARQQHPGTRYATHLQESEDTSIVQPGELDALRSSAICGQCHAISRFADEQGWLGEGSTYRPGELLEPTIRVVRHPVHEIQPWLDAEVAEDPDFFAKRFWPDGEVRISGREYNGLIESPCYQGGEFGCLSCHSMHRGAPDDQLDPEIDADTSCTQCHREFGDNLSNHTHHVPASEGSRCANCHMPHTTYGLLKAIRSHEISSPDLSASITSGRPNACNLCHLDQTQAWTGHWLTTWFGQDEVGLEPDEREVAAGILWLLRGDAGVRALVAWHFGWGPAVAVAQPSWAPPFLSALLIDEYAAVRHIASRTLATFPGYQHLDFRPVSDEQARRQTSVEIFSNWGSSPQSTGCRPELLTDASCQPDRARYQELLRQRSNYPVILEE